MIIHMVLLRIRKDVAKQKIQALFADLAALKNKIPGLQSFSGGPYLSPEGLHKGFTHGFCMTFADEKARDRYLTAPDHEKVKKSVLVLLDGGLDGVIAFDYAS